MKRYSLWFFYFLISFTVSAQQEQKEGDVRILADPRIEKLTRLKTEEFLRDSTSNGFRIQIYVAPKREQWQVAETAFKAMHPDIPTYFEYSAPNYKLRVGDFRSRLDAQSLFFKLYEEYPNLFLVPDQVNPKQYRQVYF